MELLIAVALVLWMPTTKGNRRRWRLLTDHAQGMGQGNTRSKTNCDDAAKEKAKIAERDQPSAHLGLFTILGNRSTFESRERIYPGCVHRRDRSGTTYCRMDIGR